MKVSDAVKSIMNAESKTVVLATTDNDNKVNLAMFGSPELADEETFIMMLGDNRSFANLQKNPKAACLVMVNNGKYGMQADACRIYLNLKETSDEGPEFDAMKAKIKAKIGDAAEMLKHRVVFEIIETRPILDLGQGI